METKNHFGVYGVCLLKRENCFALRKQETLSARFDLPGGSQEVGGGTDWKPSREKFLVRDGYTFSYYSLLGVMTLVQEEGKDFLSGDAD